MEQVIYRLDEIGKAILLKLAESGRDKTLAQAIIEAGYSFSNERQIEVANALESMGLIDKVTYQLPLRIRAEVSPIGKAIVNVIRKRDTRYPEISPDHIMINEGRTEANLPS